jgi:nucleoside-diphosphate-sugar epimerase
MNGRSVSVTGVSGFVGWHLAAAFRDAGWRVRGIVRPGRSVVMPDGVDRHEATFDRHEMAAACGGSEVVVHAAGLTRSADPSAFTRVNVDGTRAVVDAANQVGARLIYMSSQAALGASAPGAESAEDDPPRPLNAYGRSKLEAEYVVSATARAPWTILRPSSIYGPRDRQFLPLFREAARGRFWLIGGASMSLTLVHVRDVATAAVLSAAAASSHGRLFMIGHPLPASASDVLQAIADAVGRTYRPIVIPRAVLGAVALFGEISWRVGYAPLFDRARLAEFDAGNFVCSVARARAQLGFSAATSLREGMAETWAWYRGAGWA